jgi:hypothetical protein
MKKLALAAALATACFIAYATWQPSADAGRALFYDRVWVDHVPTAETDEIQVFAAITEEPIGIFQHTSMWRGRFELFRHEPRGDGKLQLLFPQTKSREQASYRAAKCGERGFDFCLDLGGASRGVKRYYSKKGWELSGARTPAALADQVGHLLDHATTN